MAIVRVTVFEPDVLYMTPNGFSEVEEAGDASNPKSQVYVHATDELPVFVKSIPAVPQSGAVEVKLDTGLSLIFIV